MKGGERGIYRRGSEDNIRMDLRKIKISITGGEFLDYLSDN
jgi:hypothetical protein